MTAPQGPVTGHAGKRGRGTLSTRRELRQVTPRCPGPEVEWCPVQGCPVDHPNDRTPEERAEITRARLARMFPNATIEPRR